MNDRSPILIGALAGAVAGGLLGFLYFTPEGRRVRDSIEPRLGDFVVELQRARHAVERARQAASEGWDSVRHLDSTLRGREPM